jgi:predicted AAA+ superfamily ATPase
VLPCDSRAKGRLPYGLFDEVYLSDVVERNHLTKSQELEDLVACSLSHRSPLEPSKIEATFRSELRLKLDADTIKRYLGHLEEAFPRERGDPYDVKGRRYIGTSKKYTSRTWARNARYSSGKSRSRTLWRTSSTTSCARGGSLWMSA